MKQLYKKHNSFIDLKIKKKSDIKIFLNNLRTILDDKKNLINLDNNYLKIIEYIKKDLYFSGYLLMEGKIEFDLNLGSFDFFSSRLFANF